MRAVQVWRTLRLSAGLLAAAVIVASGATVRAQEGGTAAPAGDATKGKEVFFSYYCSSCHGSRVRADAAAVKLGDKTIRQLCDLPLREALEFLNRLTLTKSQQKIAGDLLEERNDVGE